MKIAMTMFVFLFLVSVAEANYRCYNWKVSSIGKEASGAEFFYMNGGKCKKYKPGDDPFMGPVIEKKNSFFKVVLKKGSLDKHIRKHLLARTDVFDRYLEFDLGDGSFANCPEELCIDINSKNLVFVNLMSTRIH